MNAERLAIDGGTPVRTAPWFSVFQGSEEFDEAEKQAILRVLDKKRVFRYLAAGLEDSETARLEAAFRDFIGVKHALGVNGGTAALIAALVGAGVGPGDEVIVPAYTFIATPAAVLAARGIPVVCEVDNSLTMDPADFEAKITPSTKAVIPVHMRGVNCRMDEIMAVARRHNLLVIEDAAQADGGSYKGRMLGAIGDAGCFSLQQYKVITAGEGGMVTTNNEQLYMRARMQHDAAMRFWDDASQTDLGFAGENYRLSELSGALALVQFSRIGSILQRLRAAKSRITAGLRDVPGIELQDVPDPAGDVGVVQIFYVPTAELAPRFSEVLKAEGIPNGSIYNKGIPDRHIYTYWDYVLAKRGATPAGCPWTCAFYKGSVDYSLDMCPRTLEWLGRAIMVHLSQFMTERDTDDVVRAVRKVAAALVG